MNSFKKDLACNIALIVVLVFTAVHLLVLSLNLFGVTALTFAKGFNYVVAYILVVACLALYILAFFVVRLKNWLFPVWLRIVFYVAFFLFTNTYYILGLYQTILGLIIFYAYLSFIVNILCVTVFYNVQKDENNKLKTSKNYITTSVFLYSVAINSIILLLISIFKAFVFAAYVYSTLSAMVVELSVMTLVCVIMAVIFYLSLSKNKTFINGCLIKHIL